MSKGISLHVGVNNPNFPTLEALNGCENDARAMRDLPVNFLRRDLLVAEDAKLANVKELILAAAAELQAGDIFVFTFAGHGSQKAEQATDHSNAAVVDEIDGKDESIVLHDLVLFDDYLRRILWSQFAAGVRILGIADSCHSGTVLTAKLIVPVAGPLDLFPFPGPVNAFAASSSELSTGPFEAPHLNGSITQGINSPQSENEISADPASLAMIASCVSTDEPSPRRLLTTSELEDHMKMPGVKEIYDEQKTELPANGDTKLRATLMTLAACKDQENALEEPISENTHGRFTRALLNAMQTSPASYQQLMNEISDSILAQSLLQHPVRFPKDSDPLFDASFLAQQPFSI